MCKTICGYHRRPERGPKCTAHSWPDCELKFEPERQPECGAQCYSKLSLGVVIGVECLPV